MNLTEKQTAVYTYIKDYIQRYGRAPSYEEIQRHFGFRSLNAVWKHVKTLESKGLIRTPWGNKKRALELVEYGAPSITLPLAGRIAAGQPIEAIENLETIDVPANLIGRGGHFTLRVRGESMILDGIFDGDIIVVRKQDTAENGQIVVALLDNEATVKRFYRRGDQVELHPANATMPPIIVTSGELRIQGVVVGLFRKYL